MEKLYESLKRQSCKDFEWLVVDDGSTDGTDNLIGQLQEKSEFPVRYIYKSNGGKTYGFECRNPNHLQRTYIYS